MHRGRYALLALTVLASLSILQPANADPKGGLVTAQFHCQIIMAFPAAVPQAPKTNCNGGANGAMTDVTGKNPGAWRFQSDRVTTLTKGFGNFRMYNIVYSDICGPFAGLPVVPPVSTWSGHLTIQSLPRDDAPHPLAYFHAQFALTRVNAQFMAILTNPHAHNGIAIKGHKGEKAGGFGNIQGVITFKPPIGNCAVPNPQQEVVVDGTITAMLNLT